MSQWRGAALAALVAHNEEFDPGSGRTLAACLMHASRTHILIECEWRTAEEHVGICPSVGDNSPKGVLIPHTLREEGKPYRADGGTCGPSGCWRGNGPPSR